MQTKEPCDVISSGMLIKNAWDIFNLCRSSLLRMRTANLFYGSIKCVSLVSILHISWKLTDTLQWSSASNSSSKIPQQDKKKRFSKRVFEEKLLVCESRKYLYNVTSPRHSGNIPCRPAGRRLDRELNVSWTVAKEMSRSCETFAWLGGAR